MHRPKSNCNNCNKTPGKEKVTYTIVLLQQLPREGKIIFLTEEKNFPRGSGK